MTETTTPARIKRIEVIGLFGLYDHVIDLNLAERVTILHGPNGVGKTVLLEMIRAILSDKIGELAQVPFQRFSIDFIDGTDIKVAASIEITQGKVGPRGRSITHSTKWLTVSRGEASTGFDFQMQTTSPAVTIFAEAGMNAGFISRHAQQFPGTRWSGRDDSSIWDFEKPPQVHIIEAQRISRRPGPGGQAQDPTTRTAGLPAVWTDAIDLERQIASLLQKYGTVAQELDQSFPTRLLQRSGQHIDPQELKQRMSAVEALRTALQSNGILDETNAKPFNVADLDSLSQAQTDVMTLYVEDNEQKLGVFADLLLRIELLLRIVNSRLRNKTLRADHKLGLVALDHRGNPLELRSLSSGEQQQIILLYDLLFRVKPNTLVLIDEPELSLHVLWQERFLPDLLEIVKVAGIDVVIATHSPFIVGDRSDLMVALDAENDHDEPLQR